MTEALEDRKGRCYELAARRIVGLDDERMPPNTILVHGYPTLTGGPHKGHKYGHAWLEYTHPTMQQISFVWDAVHNVELPAPLYYAVGNINPDECVRYTEAETRHMLRMHMTYGPWAESPAGTI